MCGIFGYVGTKKNAPDIVLEGLKTLEYRGYDSWGVAAVPLTTSDTKHTITLKKQAGKIGAATVADLPESNFSFGHTRWATHGGVTDENAHPHIDCTGTISVIHNGIIENYEQLKTKLLKSGHIFRSETDTEVAVHLIEEYAKRMMFTKAVQKAFNEMDGLNALIVMNTKDHKFIAARNGSPLVIGFGFGENYLASDAAALLPHTKQVHYLEDGEMAIVSEKGVMIFNAKTGSFIHPKKQTLTWTIKQAEKGQYQYFMLKEIYEQPGIVTDIASGSTSHAARLAKIIKKADTTYMVGCGTAAYAGLAGTLLFSTIAKHPAVPVVGSEFAYYHQFLTKKSLMLALSQSGETMDTLEAVKLARSHDAVIMALVNVLGSTLYRDADYKMLIGSGPEKSVASTKALIGKLSHLVLLAYALANNVDAGQKVLVKAVKSSQAVLKKSNVDMIERLAKALKDQEHLYVIGRGLSYPVALEAALKVKEISYIHAEGFAAGELKHGVLALVTKNTPCLVFAPADETQNATLAGAMEMKARGGYIIGVGPKPQPVFDYFIQVQDAGPATIIPNIITAQLLAYYLTLARGFDPDMPRNLAKSVTVK